MLTYNVFQLKVEQYGFKNYVYIIIDKETGKTAVIDPSWDSSLIVDALKKMKLRLDIILLTHSHIDHAYCVDSLLKKYENVEVFISSIEQQYYGYSVGNLDSLLDEAQILLGGTKITCMLTPGHTKGSMCYLLNDSFFTGDTIYAEGCGICSTTGGDASEMYRSIQRIKKSVNPHTRIYAGHSFGKEQGMTLKEISRYNIYFQMNDINDFIKFRNREMKIHYYNFI